MGATTQVTKAQAKFLDGVVALRQTEPESRERAYMTRHLVQCTLPHSNPGPVKVWSRKNGRFTLSIVPGVDPLTGESFGYPYGVLPRLLLFWIVREATITKSRRLCLGPSFTRFMEQLGLNRANGSGERSDARRLRRAMFSLFRATLTFEYSVDANGATGRGWWDMKVAPKGFLWWDERASKQQWHGTSWLELSEDFYSSIADGPVPVHTAALRLLKGSALELDLYTWTTYRVSYLRTSQFIRWSSLAEQFGSDYKSYKEFQRKASAALRKVRLVYPELKVKLVRGSPGIAGGIHLEPCRTAVPKARAI